MIKNSIGRKPSKPFKLNGVLPIRIRLLFLLSEYFFCICKIGKQCYHIVVLFPQKLINLTVLKGVFLPHNRPNWVATMLVQRRKGMLMKLSTKKRIKRISDRAIITIPIHAMMMDQEENNKEEIYYWPFSASSQSISTNQICIWGRMTPSVRINTIIIVLEAVLLLFCGHER